MIRSLDILQGYRLRAADGAVVGKIADLYFDDHAWIVRYVVVDTGGWLTGRAVLIAPTALGAPDDSALEYPVELTRELIENAPGIDEAKPVDRQQELGLAEHFGWPAWRHSVDGLPQEVTRKQSAEGDPNLRSAADVVGYAIAALDGEIGSVSGLLVETAGWSVRALTVDTGKWLSGRQVVLSPDRVKHINWAERRVEIDLSTEQVRNSPPYDGDASVP
jgi:uncharacterized protein YrrD